MTSSLLSFFALTSPHPRLLSSSPRPDVRAVDDAGLPGLELERVVHPGAMGLSLPDSRQHLLLAADRLPVRLHLRLGHLRLPASAAVCLWRGHRGKSYNSNVEEMSQTPAHSVRKVSRGE